MVTTIILVFAFVLCVIHSFIASPRPAPYPWLPHLGWLAMALFILTFILGPLSGRL
jgi:hypothetical protein